MFLKNYIISVEVDMVLQQHENYTHNVCFIYWRANK